ncbi:hypothetical protein ACWF7H_20250 [Peribacillus butanolivorans]|uniref:hypothetical protein n=1 Tax=Peribacillus butanolivorans TaxID=421767 RepID=UPI00369112F7
MSGNHLFNTLSDKTIYVFFDESGKGNDRPNLMGSLSIPKDIYKQEIFSYYNYFLRKKEINLHWKKYRGEDIQRMNMVKAIELLFTFLPFIKLNVINYNSYYLKGRPNFTQKDIDNTIYTKFPERLIYGQIRGYGHEVTVNVEIFIDKANEYSGRKKKSKKLVIEDLGLNEQVNEILNQEAIKNSLPVKMINTLNSQSMYRGENFYTNSCKMYPKNVEIGLELIDLFLGFVRIIIQNPNPTSKGEQAKVEFIFDQLQNEDFCNFLENLTYFEWKGTQQLNKFDFKDYINAFKIKRMYG